MLKAFRSQRTPEELGLPGEKRGRLTLPLDDRMHEDAHTEWWYYTGFLTAEDGTRYGYELTAFKLWHLPYSFGPVKLSRFYEVDFAITDVTRQRFFSSIRLRPRLPGFRMDSERLHVSLGRTEIEAVGPLTYHLRTRRGHRGLDFMARAVKKPVAQADDGYIEMGAAGGSFYSSVTRLETTGYLIVDGQRKSVQGMSWMDHQWGNWNWRALTKWNWMSVRLDDGTDLMAFVFGEGTPVATLYDKQGRVDTSDEVRFTATGEWRSPVTGTTYPSGWQLSVPQFEASLTVRPEVLNQEVVCGSDPSGTYWEGACDVIGDLGEKPVSGKAYVELAGYARVIGQTG